MKKFWKKKKEKKCGNCPLFEKNIRRCRVAVRLDENTVEKVPVDAEDDCFWLSFEEGEIYIDQLIWRHKNGKEGEDGEIEFLHPPEFFKE